MRPEPTGLGGLTCFLNAEACVNIEVLISTSEAFLKCDWYFGARKRLIGETHILGIRSVTDFLGAMGNYAYRSPRLGTFLKNNNNNRGWYISF